MIISHKWKQLMMIEILLAQKILNATVSIEGFATYHLTNNKIYPYHFSSGCCHSILRTLVYIRSRCYSNQSIQSVVRQSSLNMKTAGTRIINFENLGLEQSRHYKDLWQTAPQTTCLWITLFLTSINIYKINPYI